MDLTAFTELRAMPRLVSSAVMLALSVWLVWQRGSNHAHRGFALFLTSFGMAVFCNTMGAFAQGDPNKTAWFTLTKHFEIIEIPALIYFISEYPRPRGWFGGSALMRANLILVVIAMEILVILDPTLWFSSQNGRSGLAVGVSGPINAFASKDNLAMAIVALVLAFDYARLQPGARRSSLLLVWLGFALNSLYDSTTSSFWIVRGWLNQVPLPEFFWNQVVYVFNLLALAFALAAIAVMGRSLAKTAGPTFTTERRLLLLTLPLPILAAWLETILAPDKELFDSPFKLMTNGLVRLSLALLPAYALMRYKVFDIDLKVKFTLRHSTAIAMLAGVFFLVSAFLEASLSFSTTTSNVLACIAIALTLKPIELLAKRVVDRLMPRVEPGSAYLEERKHEVYRAALETAMDDGRVTEKERRMLSALATELGLATHEIQAIESSAAAKAPAPVPSLADPDVGP